MRRRPPTEAQIALRKERVLEQLKHSLAVAKAMADYKKQCRERRKESEQIKKVRRMLRAENINVAAISRELGMGESDVRFYLRKFGFLLTEKHVIRLP
jgi:hypothetical protein